MSCNSQITITVTTNIINGLYSLPGTQSMFKRLRKIAKSDQ